MTRLAEVLPFAELLERAAFVIRTHADELRAAHTIAGRWPQGEEVVREEFDELAALAHQLGQSAKYHRPNPLGGPAVVFDACADSIRAGDSIESAMQDYRLAWRKSSAAAGVEGKPHGDCPNVIGNPREGYSCRLGCGEKCEHPAGVKGPL